MVITATQIRPLRNQAINDDETEGLKAMLARLRRERQPLCLNAAEFESILRWKLRQQIGRTRRIRVGNTDDIICAITGLALTIAHSDKEYELELRVNTLCLLRGVGVPVASAVLALTYPQEYAVIDFRVWWQLFDEEKKTFSIADYKKYMEAIRTLADGLGWPVQEVDHAIWEYDRRYH